MTKIVVSALHPNSLKTFIYDLTSEQGDTILGGFYPDGFKIMNTADRTYIDAIDKGVRTDGGGVGSVNYHDNNVKTTTSSRSIYNTFGY